MKGGRPDILEFELELREVEECEAIGKGHGPPRRMNSVATWKMWKSCDGLLAIHRVG